MDNPLSRSPERSRPSKRSSMSEEWERNEHAHDYLQSSFYIMLDHEPVERGAASAAASFRKKLKAAKKALFRSLMIYKYVFK